jgi:hypothetical protein
MLLRARGGLKSIVRDRILATTINWPTWYILSVFGYKSTYVWVVKKKKNHLNVLDEANFNKSIRLYM